MKYKLGDRVPCSIPIDHISEWIDVVGKHHITYKADGCEYDEEALDRIMAKEKAKCEITLGKQLELLTNGDRIVLFNSDDEEIFHGDMRDCPDYVYCDGSKVTTLKDKRVMWMDAVPCFNDYSRTVYVEMVFTLEV